MDAVIFDMDGVLVDSVAHKHRAFERFFLDDLELTGVSMDELIGLSIDDKYALLAANAGLELDESEFHTRVDENIDEIYLERVELLPVLDDVVATLEERGLKTGLASAAKRRWVDLVARRFELDDSFDAMASVDDVPGESKPEPDVYLAVARRLDAAPEACIAVEDSRHGATAAKRAGMYCVGYRPPENPAQELDVADEVATGPDELGAALDRLTAER